MKEKLNISEKTTDSLMVGYDHAGGDTAVLVIARKRPNQSVEIINAFEGANATELYNKLLEREKKEDESSVQ